MVSENPLVSCLCITKNRVAKLKRSIDCFIGQSYPDKELLIVYEDDDRETAEYVQELIKNKKHPGITSHEVKSIPKLTLGQLRNISIEQCTGEYFCQWDDDDWYHRDRIKIQLETAITNYHPASILTNWILYDSNFKKAYFSLFRLWEGSILCKKSIIDFSLQYPAWGVAEDTIFINKLVARSRVFPVVNPNLYIYEIHRNNTWSSGHSNNMISFACQLSENVSEIIGNILGQKYSVSEASDLLQTREILQEIKYFHYNNINASNTEAKDYKEQHNR